MSPLHKDNSTNPFGLIEGSSISMANQWGEDKVAGSASRGHHPLGMFATLYRGMWSVVLEENPLITTFKSYSKDSSFQHTP